MILLESISLKEMSLEDLKVVVSSLVDKHGPDSKIFWYSERFRTDSCYFCIYREAENDCPTPR